MVSRAVHLGLALCLLGLDLRAHLYHLLRSDLPRIRVDHSTALVLYHPAVRGSARLVDLFQVVSQQLQLLSPLELRIPIEPSHPNRFGLSVLP